MQGILFFRFLLLLVLLNRFFCFSTLSFCVVVAVDVDTTLSSVVHIF